MPRDYSIAECEAKVTRFRAANPTVKTYQKFTCDGCGTRLTMPEANVWYQTGTCDQCSTVTDIAKKGCGFVLTFDPNR